MSKVRRALLAVAGLSSLARLGGAKAQSGAIADGQVLVVSSDTSAASTELLQELTSGFGMGAMEGHALRLVSLPEFRAQAASLPLLRMAVALGLEASRQLAASSLPVPILCALIPRGGFQSVLRASGRQVSAQFTALVLDQPLARQLALIRLALPKSQRIGLLTGPESIQYLPSLRALAGTGGWQITQAGLAPGQDVFAALRQVLDDSDLMLALPDPAVFNGNTLQNILLAALRARVPLVGFSPAYVRAGAMLSVHVTPAQVGAQLGRLLNSTLAAGQLPASMLEPDTFEVAVNTHVARVLGFDLDAQALKKQLLAAQRSS